MNSTPDDELISAYLDDELNEAERARVEAMLVEQPETRQLLEDLPRCGAASKACLSIAWTIHSSIA